MTEIKISVDIEKKTIEKIEGAEKIDPISLSKLFLQMALGSLMKVQVKQGNGNGNKIIKPKIKIIGE